MSAYLGRGKYWGPADHTSERTTTRWDDCAPCSMVMLARAAGRTPPSTVAEAQALRRQAGYSQTGPTNYEGLRPAWTTRYRATCSLTQPYDPVAAIPRGYSAAVIGSMGAFSYSHRLRRWDRAFAGDHSVFVARLPDGGILWDDPLAPEGIGYYGERITADQLRAYYRKAGASRKIAYLTSGKYIMPNTSTAPTRITKIVKAVTSTVPVNATIKAGTLLYDFDGTTRLSAMSVDAVKVSPFACGTQRAIYATLNGVTRAYLCTPAKVAAVLDYATGVKAGIAKEKLDVRTRLGL